MASNQLILEHPAKSENRRRSTRHKVKILAYIDLGSNNGGTLIDVSDGGLSFQGIQPLELGQILHVGFKLSGIAQPFKVTGQIAWLCDSRKRGGLRFIELPELQRNLIKQWVEAMEPGDLDEQSNSRPAQLETKKDHSRAVLPALVDRNRPAGEAKNLGDMLRDSTVSREAVIAAVNANRWGATAGHSRDSMQPSRFPHHTRVNESVRTKLPAIALKMPLTPISGNSRLGLKVERTGDDWQVRWNRNSDALSKAVRGSLSITDGPIRKELELEISELRSGSIIYTPATDNVILRLQVVTENLAQPVSESVRIVASKVR